MPKRGQTCRCGRHVWNSKRWELAVIPSPEVKMTPQVHRVHNWHIELDIGDTAIATGTESEDGGFSMTITQRDQGKSVPAVVVSGHVELDSERLWLTIRTQDPKDPLFQLKTKR